MGTSPLKDASNSRVESNHALAVLVRRARRRHLLEVAVDEASLALAIFFGGAILLLVLGTQLLDWYWLALLSFAAVGFACYRARQRFVPAYAVARGHCTSA